MKSDNEISSAEESAKGAEDNAGGSNSNDSVSADYSPSGVNAIDSGDDFDQLARLAGNGGRDIGADENASGGNSRTESGTKERSFSLGEPGTASPNDSGAHRAHNDAGTGAGYRRRRRRNPGSGAGTENRTPESETGEEERNTQQGVPRDVAAPLRAAEQLSGPVPLAGIVDFAFIAASLVLGDHWRLSDAEAKQLGRALEKALGTIPTRKRNAVLKILGAWGPWLGLAATATIIIKPRVEIQLAYARRKKEFEERAKYQSGRNPAQQQSGAAPGAPGQFPQRVPSGPRAVAVQAGQPSQVNDGTTAISSNVVSFDPFLGGPAL